MATKQEPITQIASLIGEDKIPTVYVKDGNLYLDYYLYLYNYSTYSTSLEHGYVVLKEDLIRNALSVCIQYGIPQTITIISRGGRRIEIPFGSCNHFSKEQERLNGLVGNFICKALRDLIDNPITEHDVIEYRNIAEGKSKDTSQKVTGEVYAIGVRNHKVLGSITEQISPTLPKFSLVSSRLFRTENEATKALKELLEAPITYQEAAEKFNEIRVIGQAEVIKLNIE